MARSRNIKPGFFLNDTLADIQPLGRLLFIGLWTIADFKGCVAYSARKIKAQVLPYDDCDIESLLINLEKARFIRSYVNCGKRYIKIVNFEMHQNPHKNERDAGSDIPDYDEKTNEINELSKDGTKTDLIGSNRADSLLLIPDSLLLIPVPPSGRRTGGRAMEAEDKMQIGFASFWSAYPKKTAKPAALKAFRAQKINEELPQILEDIASKAASNDWTKENGQFVPNPAKYLDQRRWEDGTGEVKNIWAGAI